MSNRFDEMVLDAVSAADSSEVAQSASVANMRQKPGPKKVVSMDMNKPRPREKPE